MMDIPNKNRLRIGAVIGATMIAGLIGSTAATASSGSGGPVLEGAGARHANVVVPQDVWSSKCGFLVAQAAEVAAKEKAAALAAAELKAAELKAAEVKAAEVKAAEKAAAKAAKAEKAKSQSAHHKHHKHHKHHAWSQTADANKSKHDGTCDGHKGDAGSSDKTDS